MTLPVERLSDGSDAMKIDLKNLPKLINPSFYHLLTVKKPYCVVWGGAGSGKSYFTAQKHILRILSAMDKGKRERFLFVRKTQPAARRSIFELTQEILREWDLTSLYKVNKSNMTINFKGGCDIWCVGLDDPEKIKSIQGVTSIWIEEATEINPLDFSQLDLRLRGKCPSYHQITLTFNPIDIQSWIKDRFFDNDPDPDATYKHHSIYTDNIFDTSYESKLNRLTDANHIKIYKHGQWGELKGLIYENYEVIKNWPTDEFDLHGYGLDFGYSNHPTCVVECGFIKDDCYIRELLYKTGLTNQEIAEALRGRINYRNSYICADSAEPKSIDELRQLNYLVVPCTKGPDSIRNGIQRVKQFNLKIHDSSISVLKELKAYKWAEDKDGRMLNKPVDAFNHAMDAMRYIVVHLKGMISPTIEIFSGEEDEKAERKEFINSEEYNILDDDLLWDDLDA